MKDIKCPLCDSKLVKRCAYDYESIVALTCLNCGYQILDEVDLNLIRNNEYNHALSISDHEAAERFISKFPPIMRLRQGDNVMVHFGDGAHTVLYTNVDRGKIYLQDVYGNAQSYDVDEIEKWPWELERKGGSHDNM